MAFEPSVGSGVRKGFIKPDPRMIAVKLGTACLFNVCSCSIDGKTDRRELAAHQMRFGSGGRPQGKIGIAPREVCHLCRSDQFKPDIRIKRRQLRDECHKQREQGIGGGQADCSGGAQILAGKPPFERDNAAIHLLRKGDHRFTGRCRGIAFALAIKQAYMGTHTDALNHFGLNGRIYNGFAADEFLGDLCWKKAGAETIPPIIARGVMIDVAAAHGVAMLPPGMRVGAKDLKLALTRQNVALRPGDVVLIRTGRMRLYEQGEAFITDAPGLGMDAARFLVESGAMVVGADNLSFEAFPSEVAGNYVPVHTYLLAQHGVPIIELAFLEDLARDGMYEFAFIGGSLKFRGASAAPIRPVAIPLRRSRHAQ